MSAGRSIRSNRCGCDGLLPFLWTKKVDAKRQAHFFEVQVPESNREDVLTPCFLDRYEDANYLRTSSLDWSQVCMLVRRALAP